MYIYTSSEFYNDAYNLAKIYSEECRQFGENCFLDMKETNRITFLGHGMVENKEVVFGDSKLSPHDFVKHLIKFKLPKAVMTIDIIACYVGFLQHKPTYLAKVAEILNQSNDYKHVQVRGVTFADLEKNFVQMSFGFGERPDGQIGLLCLVFTEKQAKARKDYDREAIDYIRESQRILTKINRTSEFINEIEIKIAEANDLLEKLESDKNYMPTEEENEEGLTNDLLKESQKEYIDKQSEIIGRMKGEIEALKIEEAKMVTQKKALYEKYKIDCSPESEGGCGNPLMFFDANSSDLRAKLDSPEFLITPLEALSQESRIKEYLKAESDKNHSKKQKTDIKPMPSSSSHLGKKEDEKNKEPIPSINSSAVPIKDENQDVKNSGKSKEESVREDELTGVSLSPRGSR